MKSTRGKSGFHFACEAGNVEVVKLLISKSNLRINQKDDWVGGSAFHSACMASNIEVVQLLISMDDLDINATDKDVII
eukprot:CAMPEP_0117051524 /NCGR_PEP_ID=MMETSP0472-20121206/35591_1 /TAXON_ID=693140 ORGANISM="Tiarina fusus, Strain LIS" /NCGR_SAMPLE_ID=MMETSP0472 /ASSEMBLY_ACC=CAM_ASM_000603 /LENGTH=77 /DNA_ID=CAMNT_0004765753 /DNA_START=168 /DNA_END=401 /DNA_ORIENTATION=-